jgi:hypothetical protein
MVHFMAIWSIFEISGIFYSTFGIFCGHLARFPHFWYIVPRKIWQPRSVPVGEAKVELNDFGFFSTPCCRYYVVLSKSNTHVGMYIECQNPNVDKKI